MTLRSSSRALDLVVNSLYMFLYTAELITRINSILVDFKYSLKISFPVIEAETYTDRIQKLFTLKRMRMCNWTCNWIFCVLLQISNDADSEWLRFSNHTSWSAASSHLVLWPFSISSQAASCGGRTWKNVGGIQNVIALSSNKQQHSEVDNIKYEIQHKMIIPPLYQNNTSEN